MLYFGSKFSRVVPRRVKHSANGKRNSISSQCWCILGSWRLYVECRSKLRGETMLIIAIGSDLTISRNKRKSKEPPHTSVTTQGYLMVSWHFGQQVETLLSLVAPLSKIFLWSEILSLGRRVCSYHARAVMLRNKLLLKRWWSDSVILRMENLLWLQSWFSQRELQATALSFKNSAEVLLRLKEV